MRTKRIITWFTAAIMAAVMCLLPFSGAVGEHPDRFAVNAAVMSGSCGANVWWNLSDDGVLSITGKGFMTDYYPTASPFYKRDDIVSVIIGEDIYSIGSYAFSNCSELTGISIPHSVTTIGSGAFISCSKLANVTLPESITTVSDSLFAFCQSLTGITIPSSVTSIEDYAFMRCTSLAGIAIMNPNCAISSAGAISDAYADNSYSYSGTIYGYSGSTAEDYAHFKGMKFSSLGEAPSDVTDSNEKSYEIRPNFKFNYADSSIDDRMVGWKWSDFGIKDGEKAARVEVNITSASGPVGKWQGAFGTSTTKSPDYWSMSDDMEYNIKDSTATISWDIPKATSDIIQMKYAGELKFGTWWVDCGKFTIDSVKVYTNGSSAPVTTQPPAATTAPAKTTTAATTLIVNEDYRELNLDLEFDTDKLAADDRIVKWAWADLGVKYGEKPVRAEVDISADKAIGKWQGAFGTSTTQSPDYYFMTDDIIHSFGNNTATIVWDIPAATSKIIQPAYNGEFHFGTWSAECKKFTIKSVRVYISDPSAPVTTRPPVTTTKPITTTTVKPAATTTAKPPTTTTTVKPVTTTTTTTKPAATTTKPSTTAPKPIVTNGFEWGRDNWNFKNNRDYFTRGKYYLDDNYLSVLRKNMSEKEWDGASSLIGKNWGGSCYGMSATTILANRNLLTYGLYTSGADCLNKIKSPAENPEAEYLINYYHILQVTDCIQQHYRDISRRSNEENIKDIISKLKDNSMVLLGYQQKSFGGHSVVAYGVTYQSWRKNGVTYNGRIEIIDPNYSTGYDENSCIYFNTQTYDWAIPNYQNVTSAKKASFNMILSETDIINNGGFLSGIKINYSGDYTASLEVDTDSEESVSKAVRTLNGLFINQSSDGPDDIVRTSFYFLGGESGEISGYILKDCDSAYRTSLDSPDEMNLKIDYENCRMEAGAVLCDDIVFDPEGFASISGAGTDYSFSMVYNKEFCPTDWYKISVSGQNADKVSLEKTEEGYVMSANNLSNVNVTANNYTVSAERQFSTDKKSVLIYEIDEETIGIREDSDGDGVYDSELGETPTGSDKTKVPEGAEPTSYGDTNMDGAVNIADVVQLNKFLLNKKDNPIKGTALANSDCMKDGYIDSSDSTFLMNYVSMQITEDKLGA